MKQKITVCATVLLLCLAVMGCGKSKSLEGKWKGSLNVQGTSLSLIFNIAKSGDIYTAKVDSPDQKSNGMPLENVSLNGDTVKMELKAVNPPGSFEGKWNADNTEIAGAWKQGPFSLPLTLTREAEGDKK